MSVDIKRITSLSIYDIDYRYSIAEITKSEAIDLLKNADLSEKRQIISKYNFFICI